MQTPEDRFYNPSRINAWFAASTVLVLAATAAAVLADHYDREWKGYQQSFYEMERGRAETAAALKSGDPAKASAEAAAVRDKLLHGDGPPKTPTDLDEATFLAAIDALKAEPAFAAGAALAARHYEAEAAALRTPEFEEECKVLRAARKAAEDGRFRTELEQRELKAQVDEHKFRRDHATGEGHAAEAAEETRIFDDLVAREAEVHQRMDDFAAAKEKHTEDLAAKLTPVSLREGRARRLYDIAGVTAAEKKISGWIVKGLRDAPILDPIAPVLKIEQTVIPDLTVDYNFVQTPRIDRCVTCHKGIDKVKVAKTPADPVRGIAERTVVTPLYGEKDENGKEIPRVLRTHPRPDLYVSSVSKHSLTQVGCTVCHGGQGPGLSFTDAYHTPDTWEQEKEWEEKYHWHQGESWSFPMLPRRHFEAACFQCHRDPTRFAPADRFMKEIPGAPKWNRGLHVVESRGCFGCHEIDGLFVPGLDKWLGEIPGRDAKEAALAVATRKVGPSLRRLPSKLPSEAAAAKWIWDPRHLRPTSKMPRFFGQPNNSGPDPLTSHNYDLRTRTEVAGIAAYLWDGAEPFDAVAPITYESSAARGKVLFGDPEKGVGCLACHTTKDFPNPEEGGKPSDHGPDLSTVGSKVTAKWLVDWLMNPSHYWPDTRMPRLRLTQTEAADIAAYLMALRDEAWEKEAAPAATPELLRDLALEALRAEQRKNPEDVVKASAERELLRIVGKRAIQRYACYACHDIQGFEKAERIGTKLGGNEGWGSKDVDRLDFGVFEDPHAVATFEKDWLGDKAAADALVPPRGAHGGHVGRFLPHRKPEWARLKLLSPRIFDAGLTKQPHEKLLMPNFGLSEEEADAAVTFLLSLQKYEIPVAKRPVRGPEQVAAEKMKFIARKYNCYGCHTVTGDEVGDAWNETRKWVPRGRDIRPWLAVEDDDRRNFWPPTLGGEMDPKKWGTVRGEGFKVRPEWMTRFLRDPGENLLRPWLGTRMPTFPFVDREAELNALVHGFAASDRVPFPFEAPRYRALTAEERARAKSYFDVLECAKCHPTKGGTGPLPTTPAPYLTFAHDRLRPDWIRHWIDNPKSLQPGTIMPANWRDPRDMPIPKTQEHFGGDRTEQMERIVDYVIDLGAPK